MALLLSLLPGAMLMGQKAAVRKTIFCFKKIIFCFKKIIFCFKKIIFPFFLLIFLVKRRGTLRPIAAWSLYTYNVHGGLNNFTENLVRLDRQNFFKDVLSSTLGEGEMTCPNTDGGAHGDRGHCVWQQMLCDSHQVKSLITLNSFVKLLRP